MQISLLRIFVLPNLFYNYSNNSNLKQLDNLNKFLLKIADSNFVNLDILLVFIVKFLKYNFILSVDNSILNKLWFELESNSSGK